MRFAPVVVLALVFVLPGAAALHLGTEDVPEISDPAGDVAYGATYLGPKDQVYLDVLAGWFDYDPMADTVQVHLKAADFSRFSSSSQPGTMTWDSYSVKMNLTADGGEVGSITASFTHSADSGKVTHAAYFLAPQRGGASTPTYQDVPHRFSLVEFRPGYAVWTFNRTDLLHWGDDVETSTASAAEYRFPSAGVGATIYTNQDDANSMRAYPLRTLRPTTSEEPAPMDSTTVAPSPDSFHGRTVGLGAAAMVVSLAVAALARRRRVDR